MDAVIKRHKEANPWLNRDVLNNYKRLKNKEKVAAINVPLVVTRVNRDSVSTLTPAVDEQDENEPPLHPNHNNTNKKRGRPKGTTKKEIFSCKRRKQMA